jgi:hypothetical protein
MIHKKIFPFAFLISLSITGCAKHQGSSSGHVAGGYHSPGGSVSASFAFGDEERRIILEYYEQQYGGKKHKGKKGMPPGLAKREGDLPPGLAKRDKLPPGIEKQTLPTDLLKQLPPPPSGCERALIGHQVLLLEIATRIVLDTIDLSVVLRL